MTYQSLTNKEIIRYFISLIGKTFLLSLILCTIVFQLSARTITPIKMNEVDKVSEIKSDLVKLAPKMSDKYLTEVSKSIKIASDATNINEKIITSVAFYESKMQHDAKSPKGYKGIMQATTHDIYEFPEVDIMRGAKKLQNWLEYRNGNLRYALASYNGGTYPPKSSYVYADDVIQLAKKL